MNENLNTDAIRRLLNRSLTELDQSTLSGLHAARQRALQRAAAMPARSPVRVWLDTHLGRMLPRQHAAATWVAVALLIVGLLGSVGYYWQLSNDANEEVDIAILTDDLPINYYVD